MSAPDLIVTNFNRNFTGVSATAANVVRTQIDRYDLRLVGHALPGCPTPISVADARALCRGATRPVIWHVRRNPEMRAALWARDVLRLPIRIVFTSAAQRRHSSYPRWLISRMDAVIATTDQAADFVPHVRAVVPHGVDTQTLRPANDRAAAWAALGYPGTRGIATIGRIRPEKGTDLVVETMCRVLPDHPDTTALIVGRAGGRHGAFAARLRGRVADAGLSDRILFLGELPAQDVARILPALSLMVALPRYEGYGMTPLEGMAAGVPFVASDTGYFRTFSAEGTAGTVVPLDQTGEGAVGALLQDPGRLSAMGIAARDIAATRHSAQAEADGIARVYDTLWSAP